MEFGLVVPVIVIIVLGTYDLGNMIAIRGKLDDALHAGGIYAMSYPTSLTGMQTAVTAALPTGWTDVTVSTPVASCSCWATGGTVTAADCTSDPICPIGQVNQRFIALSVTRPFEPLLLPTATFNSVSTTYVVRVQ